MRPLPLTAETRRILAFVRGNRFPLSVYGRSAARVAPMVRDRVNWRINRFGAAVTEIIQYKRFTAEMLKAFRTKTGKPLADELVLVVRKWANLGLDPGLLQQLLGICHDKFHSTGHQIPKPRQLGLRKRPGPKPGGRQKRTYGQALAKGRGTPARAGTAEAQAARHRAGTSHAADIGKRLKPVLASRGISGRGFVAYFAFAQKLGRFSRNYSGRSLARAAGDCVDLYEAKGLDRDTLIAIAAVLFDVTDIAS